MPADTTSLVVQLVQLHLQELPPSDQVVVRAWLKAVPRRNCQPTTLTGYCGALKALVGSWEGHRPATLLQVQGSHIERFIDQLEARGLHPSTITTRLRCVQRFYGYLRQEAQVETLPIGAHHYEPEPLPRALSESQVQGFLAVLDHRLERAVCVLLLRSGRRLGEVVALELGDVEVEQHQLYVRRGHKNRRDRVAYFSTDAQPALRAWRQCRWSQQTPTLFHNDSGRPLNHRWGQRHFRMCAEQAGLERHLTVHSLRHTFACQLLNAGVDLVTLQELLGHDSIAITQCYARLSDRVRRAEYFHAIAQIEEEVHDEPGTFGQLLPLLGATQRLGLHPAELSARRGGFPARGGHGAHCGDV